MFIIHAPSVHSGGGLVLLRAVLSVSGPSIKWLQVDQRSKQHFLPTGLACHHVNRSVFSRLCAEWRLWRCSNENDVVLCFHGLPPLFTLRGRVVVFLQNRILVTPGKITGYPLCTKFRLLFERWLLRRYAGHVDKFIVQTPSMARDAKMTLGGDINVVALPFTASMNFEKFGTQDIKYDFVYVASGEAHKNHPILLESWRLLAEAGLKPSLALTVAADSRLASKIEEFNKKHELNICNLGTLNSSEIHYLYRSSSALIFPSTTESLGLPLIEAAQHGLPILAPEVDYVRDVATPVQTFDPHSPLSIARAVRRFLGKPEPAVKIGLPEDFLAEVLK